MYDEGDGVCQNSQKALEWYTKAANQGHPAAQYNLALMYYDGEGVKQDKHTAKEWFEKACANGDPDGCYACTRLRAEGY